MPRTALLLATLALVSVDANAHAPPYATGLSFAAAGAERSVIRTNRGLIVGSRAAGFRLVCNDAFGASLAEIVPFAELAGGGLLIGTYAGGLLRSDSALCDFDAVGPRQVSPIDVERGADGLVRGLFLPLDGSEGALFESADGGASFEQLSPVGTAPTALVMPAANPDRVYVSTTTTEGNLSIGHVLASRDGGRHFVDHIVELDAAELRVFALAVDATTPERLFVRTQSRDGVSPERLLLSADGGETFRTVLVAPGPLTLALGDAGEAWAGTADGLYRSMDGGATFEPVEGNGLTRIGCLAVHEGRIHVCALSALEFGVLVSEDAGATFEWFLRFPDVAARAECPSSSDEGSSCAAEFEDWRREQSVSTAAMAAAGASSGAPKEGVVAESAGGCALSGREQGGVGLALAVLFGACAGRRWRRDARRR